MEELCWGFELGVGGLGFGIGIWGHQVLQPDPGMSAGCGRRRGKGLLLPSSCLVVPCRERLGVDFSAMATTLIQRFMHVPPSTPYRHLPCPHLCFSDLSWWGGRALGRDKLVRRHWHRLDISLPSSHKTGKTGNPETILRYPSPSKR